VTGFTGFQSVHAQQWHATEVVIEAGSSYPILLVVTICTTAVAGTTVNLILLVATYTIRLLLEFELRRMAKITGHRLVAPLQRKPGIPSVFEGGFRPIALVMTFTTLFTD